ncbi:uncharacterized protein LOC114579197 isoform X1 [Dendrobium catenatum]|uniref:uncharacterized protein LOC114579197 isoform X1 n=1 Tax=Dendrobium catenatum TaxID=906689 RepID=UPI00109F895C|nr:uncharacterized protein LOC114579197 isoform X1 [Dendrobium catenatum]XP_028548973.1 uncharacterized protein LOC114579197 isoform X1 [Dendrobium catenatum]
MVLEEFPEYCVHCSSLEHSKAGCKILYPNLVPSTLHLSILGVGGPVVAPSVPEASPVGDVLAEIAMSIPSMSPALITSSIPNSALPFVENVIPANVFPPSNDVLLSVNDSVVGDVSSPATRNVASDMAPLTDVNFISAGEACEGVDVSNSPRVRPIAIPNLGSVSGAASLPGCVCLIDEVDLAVDPSVHRDSESNLPSIMGLVNQIDAKGMAKAFTGGDTGTMDIVAEFCALSEGNEPLSNSLEEPLLNVPLTFSSKDDLHSRISRDSEVVRGEWLHVDNFSADGEYGYEDYLDLDRNLLNEMANVELVIPKISNLLFLGLICFCG